MQLLPNEDQIILTDCRIHQSDKEWGHSYQLTIFLENISSVEMLYKSNPLFLVLAGICAVFGVVNNAAYDPSLRSGSFILAVIFLLFWLYSKSQVVTIASKGGSKLTFRVQVMKDRVSPNRTT